MRTVLVFIGLLLLFVDLKAQKKGFLYLESEQGQPFFLRSRDTVFHSAETGYLLLAPLNGLTGELVLGFPGNDHPALGFRIGAADWERGFLLRDMKAEGWRLIDLQGKEMANVRRIGNREEQFRGMLRRNDAFAMRLARVMNDTAVLYYLPVQDKTSADTIRLLSITKTADGVRLVYELRELGKLEQVDVEIVNE